MDIFILASLGAIIPFLVIGAVIKAYVLLPRQINDLEKRLRKIEHKEEK